MAKKKASGGTPAMRALSEAGIAFTPVEYTHHDASTDFGAEAAWETGIDLDRIYKTLIVSVGERLAVGVVPVSGRLDLKRIAGALGAARPRWPTRAPPSAARYVLGGVSPLGQRTPLPTVIDASARRWDVMHASPAASEGCSWAWLLTTSPGPPARCSPRSPTPEAAGDAEGRALSGPRPPWASAASRAAAHRERAAWGAVGLGVQQQVERRRALPGLPQAAQQFGRDGGVLVVAESLETAHAAARPWVDARPRRARSRSAPPWRPCARRATASGRRARARAAARGARRAPRRR